MARLLVLNNYDLRRVEGEVARGDKPAHHLFGLDALRRAGWDVETVGPADGPSLLRRLDAGLRRVRWPIPLGRLGAQARVWRRARGASVIFAPCQTEAQTLAYLRALGLVRTRLITLAHHPLDRGRLAGPRTAFLRWQLAGTDAFPALAREVAEAIRGLARRPASFAPTMAWGPDLAYYDRFRCDGPGAGFAAAGRTGRDWPTLVAAADEAAVSGEIFTPCGDSVPRVRGVRFRVSEREDDLPYPRLLPSLAQARVLAIPLRADASLAGLTSLADALGLGKPVIMTRHPLIDLDLEAEGIGRWVAPGDRAGWKDALRWFEHHPTEAAAMGRRARALAATRWNYARFSAELVALVDSVARAA
jgi:hypothetical protein